jgi:hypothetical protein
MSRTGIEGRYGDRFVKFNAITGETIKANDAARKTADQLKTALAVISSQESNITALFSTAEELVQGITTFQQMSGSKQVRNLPLPTEDIRASKGKQLGYVQLTMRFMQSGLIHFMEQMINATDHVSDLEALIQGIADAETEVPIVGDLQYLDLDQLESPQLPPSPPVSPGKPQSEASSAVSPTKTESHKQKEIKKDTTKKGKK